MALYTLTFFGFAPFGNLAIGALSNWIGLSRAIGLFALVSLAASGRAPERSRRSAIFRRPGRLDRVARRRAASTAALRGHPETRRAALSLVTELRARSFQSGRVRSFRRLELENP